MANDEHIALLGEGSEAWNAWRKENFDILPDLSGVDLSGPYTHLYGMNLSGANLSGADLSGADLSGANLDGANLSGANLRRARLEYARLHDYRPDLRVNLRGADLRGADLRATNLSGANLGGADLRGAKIWDTTFGEANFEGNLDGANLSGADLRGADLRGADLRGAKIWDMTLGEANFSGANLSGVNLERAHLRHLSEANLSGANLSGADLSGAHLSGANLDGANLSEADLRRASLNEAKLRGTGLRFAQLVGTDFTGADLTGCRIYGVSAWNLNLEGTKQQSLVITSENEPEITVDNIEVAQFIYLMLHNEKIRDVIDTITSKAVLILGRFTRERKPVLEALREELRQRKYLPILFDFEKPRSRNTDETITLLARMARFVVADISDAKSVLQELRAIVPDLPSVPVQPIILARQEEPGMFDFYQNFRSFLNVHRYASQEQLIADLGAKVIRPAELKVLDLQGST